MRATCATFRSVGVTECMACSQIIIVRDLAGAQLSRDQLQRWALLSDVCHLH